PVFAFGAPLLLAAAAVFASERSFETILKEFAAAVEAHPVAYLEEAERAWLAAEKLAFVGAKRPETRPDVGVEWNAEVQRLRAFYLRRYFGEYERLRATEEIRRGREKLEPALRAEFLRQHKLYARVLDKVRGLPDSIAHGPGRARFLGEMALLRGDTAEARHV